MTIATELIGINDKTNLSEGWRSCARSPDGNLYAIIPSSSEGKTFVAISSDDGRTWDSTTLLKNGSGSDFAMAHASITIASDGTIYVGHSFSSTPWVRTGLGNTDGTQISTKLLRTGTSCEVDLVSGGLVALFVDRESPQGLWYWNGVDLELVATAPNTGTDEISRGSLTADKFGVPHVLWTNRDDADRSSLTTVWYSNRSGGAWITPEQIVIPSEPSNLTKCNVGLTTDGVPFTFFFSIPDSGGSTQRLHYAERSGGGASGTWAIELAVPTAPVGNDTSGHTSTGIDGQGIRWALATQSLSLARAVSRTPSGEYDTSAQIALSAVMNGGWAHLPNSGATHYSQSRTGFFVQVTRATPSRQSFLILGDLTFAGEPLGAGTATRPRRILEKKRRNRIVLDIPTTDARVLEQPRGVEHVAKSESLKEAFRDLDRFNRQVYEYLRTVPDSLRSGISELAEGLPGDRRDIFEIESPGDSGHEIAVAHGLGYAPENFEVVGMSGGFGMVANARDRLADKDNFYLCTTAPKGVSLRVRVY